jgi:cell division protein ZapA
MPEINVSIGGRLFEVACQEGEEHFLRTAAAMLDAEAAVLMEQIGRMPEARMLLMAGLMLADKTAAVEDQIREMSGRVEELEAALAEAQANPVRLEVPVIPEIVFDTFAEIAARAEALAASIEERTSDPNVVAAPAGITNSVDPFAAPEDVVTDDAAIADAGDEATDDAMVNSADDAVDDSVDFDAPFAEPVPEEDSDVLADRVSPDAEMGDSEPGDVVMGDTEADLYAIEEETFSSDDRGDTAMTDIAMTEAGSFEEADAFGEAVADDGAYPDAKAAEMPEEDAGSAVPDLTRASQWAEEAAENLQPEPEETNR